MNVVDSLIVTLGIDATGVKQGAKDATATTTKLSKDMVDAADKAEEGHNAALALIVKGLQSLGATQKKTADESVKHSKAMSDATESVAQTGEKALRTFGALFLLFAGAHSVKSFVSDMLNLDAATGRLAHNTGSTTEVISGIGRAAERAGGSFEGAVGGLRSLSDAYQQLRTTGQSGIMEPLARLQGLSGKQITFGSDVHKNLLSIADALQVLDKRDPAQADFLGRQILGDETLTNIAKGGSAGVRAAEAQSPKITKDQAEAAQKLQAQLAGVRQGFQDIGNSILMDFGPAMLKGIGWVKDLIENNRALIETKVKEWVQEVGQWFDTHKEDTKAFAGAMGQLVDVAGTIAGAFIKQSPMMQAMEAFAFFMGGRVLDSVSRVLGVMRALGALTLPGWATSMLGLSGAMLGAGAAAGAMNVGHTDEYGRDAGTWGGDAPDNGSNGAHLRHRKAKNPPSPAGRIWNAVKSAVGLGDASPGAGVNGVSPDTKLSDLDAKQRADLVTALAKSEGNPGARPDYNNPGNIKWGLWTRAHGATEGGIAGVAKFPTAEAGRAAAEALLFGKSYRDLTIRQAMNKYSPRGDGANDPDAKAAFIAGRIGAPASAATATPTAQANPQQPFADPSGMIAGDLSDRSTLHLGQLAETKGLIIHHTAGRGTPEGVVDTLNQGHLGVQYVMDRDGKIFRTLPEGAKGQHILRSQINDLNNSNTQGIEVIAKDDKDVTPAQVKAGRAFVEAMAKRYPGLQVFGHGEVNPGHRPLTEGHSIVQAYRDEAGRPKVDPNYKPDPVPLAQRTLQTYMGRDTAPPTIDRAVRHVLRTMAHANHLLQHGDHPVPVTMGDKTVEHIGKRTFGAYLDYARKHQGEMPAAHAHAASLARMTRMADAGRYSHTVHNVNHSSETRIGSIAVHTAATDARGIAADIEPHLHRGQAAGRADYGLA